MQSATETSRTDRYLLLLILVVSAVLHFYNLPKLSFSNDELSALVRARYSSFGEMIRQGVYTDYHPAGVQIWIYFWRKIFGENDILLRLPFVFCSFGSIILLYKIGKMWFSSLAGLLSAALFSVSFLTVQYTQIARMYSPGMFFSILTVYGWTGFLFFDKEQRRKFWWIWLIGMTACLHTHYFSFVFAASVGVSGIFFLNKENYKWYFFGGIISLITFVPELPVFFEQMKTGDIGGWLGMPEETFLLDFFKEVFNHSKLFALLIALIFLTGLFISQKKKFVWRFRFLSATWFLFLFGVAYSYSALRHPVIQFSTLLFGLPFVFLLFSSLVPSKGKMLSLTLVPLILFTGVFTLVKAGFYTKNYFGVFREIAVDASEFPERTPVVVNVINPEYYKYYKDRIGGRAYDAIYRAIDHKSYSALIDIVENSESLNFGYVWSNEFHPWQVNGIIRDKYPNVIREHDYFNAASFLFSKEGVDQSPPLLQQSEGFESNSEFKLNTSVCHSGKVSLQVDSTNEFPFGFYYDMDKLGKIDFGYFYASVWFNAESDYSGAALVASVDSGSVSIEYASAPLSDFSSQKGKWKKAVIAIEKNKSYPPGSKLKIYLWNPSKKSFQVDDFSLRICREKDPYKR